MSKIKLVSMVLALVLVTGIFAACGKTEKSSESEAESTVSSIAESTEESGEVAGVGADTTEERKLIMYLFGPNDGVAVPDITAKINALLKEDINATIEFKGIEWSDTATKYPLIFMSGEQFDMSFGGPNTAAPYANLAKQDALTDITDLVSVVTPTLFETITPKAWEDAKVDGKIYAVPNHFTELIPEGIAFRGDLLDKYGIAQVPASFEETEHYFDQVLANEDFAPLNGDSNLAYSLYKFFVQDTGKWMKVPGLPNETAFLVADYDNPTEIIHPAYTQEFEDWVVKMKGWADKGYFPTDILSAQQGIKDNFNNGISGTMVTHLMDWTGNYGAFTDLRPGVTTEFWSAAHSTKKLTVASYAGALTLISKNTSDPARCLLLLEKFITDERYYNLAQFGIEGRQYEIVDGVVIRPASYDVDVDSSGYALWATRNDAFEMPRESEDPRRRELIDTWSKEAIDDPFVGVTIAEDSITNEQAAIMNVNSQIGVQLLLGKTPNDPLEAVAQYREQLEKAGLDKYIEEIKKQVTEQVA